MSGNNSDQEEKEMTRDDEKKPKEKTPDDNETGNDVSETVVDKKEEEEDDDDEEKDESDEESDESEVGLFDRPVEVSGVRERKQVQRLEMSFNKPAKETEISEGSGEKLGQCPRIESQVSKNVFSDLKILHRILYNRPGASNEIKKNIRKFSGFPFSEGSAEYEKKKSSIAKINAAQLKHVCTILDLERGGTKEDIVNRVLQFLLKPKPSGKKVPEGKKKKSSKAGKKTQGKKKQVAVPAKRSADSNDLSDSTSGSEGALSDEDVEEKPKKKDTSGKKKGKQKMKPPKKMKKTVESSDGCSDDDEEEGEEEEEEEEEKKDPKSSDSPTEEAIKEVIAKILKNSNLHEITMNKVFQQVCDAFPGHDLKHKKEFIKTVVKSGI